MFNEIVDDSRFKTEDDIIKHIIEMGFEKEAEMFLGFGWHQSSFDSLISFVHEWDL